MADHDRLREVNDETHPSKGLQRSASCCQKSDAQQLKLKPNTHPVQSQRQPLC